MLQDRTCIVPVPQPGKSDFCCALCCCCCCLCFCSQSCCCCCCLFFFLSVWLFVFLLFVLLLFGFLLSVLMLLLLFVFLLAVLLLFLCFKLTLHVPSTHGDQWQSGMEVVTSLQEEKHEVPRTYIVNYFNQMIIVLGLIWMIIRLDIRIASKVQQSTTLNTEEGGRRGGVGAAVGGRRQGGEWQVCLGKWVCVIANHLMRMRSPTSLFDFPSCLMKSG